MKGKGMKGRKPNQRGQKRKGKGQTGRTGGKGGMKKSKTVAKGKSRNKFNFKKSSSMKSRDPNLAAPWGTSSKGSKKPGTVSKAPSSSKSDQKYVVKKAGASSGSFNVSALFLWLFLPIVVIMFF